MASARRQDAFQRTGAARAKRGAAARHRTRSRGICRRIRGRISPTQGRSHRRGPDRGSAGLAPSRHRLRVAADADARARRHPATGWLLDTNIQSELRRLKPEPKVAAFVAAPALDLIYVSPVTLAGIHFGIEPVADATRRAELNDWLAHNVGLPTRCGRCSNSGCSRGFGGGHSPKSAGGSHWPSSTQRPSSNSTTRLPRFRSPSLLCGISSCFWTAAA